MTAKRPTRGRANIQALRATEADPNMVEVLVGGGTVATMLRHRAEELGVRVGVRWSPALAARVDAAAARALAREAAFAMLARRALAAATVQERLIAAGHTEPAAEAAVASLVADGWLDDRAYADERAQHHLRRGPVAAEALAARLTDEGVPEAVAARAAAAHAAGDPAQALTREARAARRAGDTPARVGQRFARRGFDADTIQDALASAGFRLDDDAP